ncbi:MAG TPA: FkbM family methyltransferase [Verrucomicrobiae bacterium]|nr:FkbM family methyltransferase [Verrucomicrobiae bacterium]
MADNKPTSFISFGQNGEDIILYSLLDDIKKGFYVDVGANHPAKDSVTKHFYRLGWRGMNIEPSPLLHGLLAADRPRDINLMVGVSDKAAELVFRDYERGDGLSTFSADMQQQYEKSNYYFTRIYKDYKVPVQTLEHIFKEHKVPTIDFLKVDIEGYEYEALISNDWHKYRPRVVCIEANHVFKDWHPILKKANYTKVFFDGLNEYFVRNEDEKRIQKYSYPDKVLLGPRFVAWDEYIRLNDLDREKRLLALQLKRAKQKIDELGAIKPARKPQAIDARTHVRGLVKRVDARIEHKLSTAVPTTVRSAETYGLDTAVGVAQLQQDMQAGLQKQFRHGKQAAARQYGRVKRGMAYAKRKIR